MSLQFIYGSSGAGKSTLLYKELIKSSIKNPNRNYIAIVPEQFTMETQKDIVMLHPNKGTMNIDIVSFGRLAYRVFEEIGTERLPILDDTGKNLILRKVLENKKKELKLYGSKLRKPGFVGEIKSILSEFYQYGVHDEEIDKMLKAAAGKSMLTAKLKDMDVIRKGFQEYMEEKYITKEEILDVLCNVIEKSKKIRESVISLDGFTGFTPIQYKLMGILIRLAKMVIITVTLDKRENPYHISGEQELFYLSKQTVGHLKRLAEEMQVPQNKDIFLDESVPYRFQNAEALASLERNLFRYPYNPYRKEQQSISIHVAQNPRKEAEFAVREILNLVRDKGYRYREMAVITGDINQYAGTVREVFEENKIPFFMDYKSSIMSNPAVEFIRSALGVIQEDFSYESVFRFLRSGMSDIENKDIDVLDLYCVALGIRGNRKWQTKWVRSYKRDESLDLEYMNSLRERVIERLLPLRECWKNKNDSVREKITKLYRFIADYKIQEKLSAYEGKFHEQGRLSLEKEYHQTYRLIIELFDKIVELLGDEIISGKELVAILDAGFEEIKVGLIPPSLDQILVGDVERTRLKDIKALFFLGVNDGIIPKNSIGGGLFSQLERSQLSQSDVALAPTVREGAYVQKFYLYLNLTKPSDKLYLCYSKASLDGNALRPSYLINTIKRLFPKLKEIDEEFERKELDYLTTPEGALGFWLEGLAFFGMTDETEEWKELFSWYQRQEGWRYKIEALLKASSYENIESGIGKLAASALYGPQAFHSVTRLERYSACAFAHFLLYGLKIEKRKEFEVLSADIGNLFHGAIECYSKKIRENNYSFSSVPENERSRLVKESVRETATDYGNSILNSNARNAYIIERLERITDRTVWALGEQLKKGEFLPVDYEVAFSEHDDLEALTIPISDTEMMKLKGRIDRMDVYEDEEHVYVKILDYKSGSTTFDLSSVYYGLQLQLIVYLDAAIESEKKKHPDKMVIPAGIFYYNIKDPIIETEEEVAEEDLDKLLLKELRVNGLVNEDNQIIEKLDNGMDKKSDVIPVSYNNDGSLAKSSSAISSRQFKQLTSFVRNQIKAMGQEILKGSTQIAPYEKGNRTACDFCEFRFVCGFDEKISGYHYRRLKPLSAEEIWEKIDAEEERKTDGLDKGTAEGNQSEK